MYINPFIAGIVFTILFELALVIGYGMFFRKK